MERTLPSNIVHEDEMAVAFEDVNPQAPTHVLVVPRRHIDSLKAAEAADATLLGHLLLVCAQVARHKGVAESGYRVVANTGAGAGQSVFHVHLHLLGGRRMRWPPG
jgi:histidine triad (HIT) family protein